MVFEKKQGFVWDDKNKYNLIKLAEIIAVDGYPNWSKIHKIFQHEFGYDKPKDLLRNYHNKLKNDPAVEKLYHTQGQISQLSIEWTEDHQHCLFFAAAKAKQIQYNQGIHGKGKQTCLPVLIIKQFKNEYAKKFNIDFTGSVNVVLQRYFDTVTSNVAMLSGRCLEMHDNLGFYNIIDIMTFAEINSSVSQESLFTSCCHNCGFLFFRKLDCSRKTLPDPLNGVVEVERMYDYVPYPYQNKLKSYYTCLECYRNPNYQKDYLVTLTSNNKMEIPIELASLNEYERNQVALCGGFFKIYQHQDPHKKIFEHLQGDCNIGKKEDIAYEKLFMTYYSLRSLDALEGSSEKIRAAILWLKKNNQLYGSFLANFETLYRYFITHKIVSANQRIIELGKNASLQSVVGKDTDGIIIPADDVKISGRLHPTEHHYGTQHPIEISNAYKSAKDLVNVTYADEFLEAKRWAHLFPEGRGSWKSNTSLKPQTYVKKRLLNIDNRFRSINEFSFFWIDRLFKSRILYYNNNIRIVNTKDLIRPIQVGEAKGNANHFGTNVPTSIPGSKSYWNARKFDLLAMVRDLGKPDLFITLTQNDNWPELQRQCNLLTKAELEKLDRDRIDVPAIVGNSVVNFPLETVVAFHKRLQIFFKHCIYNKEGPFGTVRDFWYRIEYQNRGALHCHMIVWIAQDTMPENVVCAEIPRHDNVTDLSNCNAQMCREYVKAFQLHNCIATRCPKYESGKLVQKCRYNFPFPINEVEELNESKIGYNYVRRLNEDQYVIPYNLLALLLWNGHINVQKVTNSGIETYLCKYISKPEKTVNVRDLTSDADRYIKSRIMGILECISIILQMPQCKSTRKSIFLPCDFVPNNRVLKRTQHLPVSEESEDIYYMNLLDKYLQRPFKLSTYTYPDFYRHFNITKSNLKTQLDSMDETDEDNEVSLDATCKTVREPIVFNGFRYSYRKRSAVVRWRYITPFGSETEKYYEQLFLLKVPIHQLELNEDGYPFSATNSSKTFVEECCIRGLVNAEENAKSAIVGAIQQGFSIARVLEIARLLVDKDFVTQMFVDSIIQPWLNTLPDIDRPGDNSFQDEMGEELQQMLDGRIAVEPYENYENTMKESQLKLMNWVKEKLEKGETIRAIITGGAGCGKSFITKALYSLFREKKMLCILLATTGAASHLIQGTTIHYYLKIDIEGNCFLQHGSLSAKIIQDTDVIIVDEFSMLSTDLLQSLNEQTTLYSQMRNQFGPFGGKHIFLIGDVCQLPSIQTSVFCNPIMNIFSILVLKETVRQEDNLFASLLNRVRIDEMTEDDKIVLSNRFVTIDKVYDNATEDVLLVTATRKKMDLYNAKFLEKVEGKLYTIIAQDLTDANHTVGNNIKALIRKYIKSRWDDELSLKEGCIVRLLRNIDVPSGWVNSKRARVKCIADDGSYVILQDLYDVNRELPLTKMKQTLKFGNSCYYRLQFPLKLGYATTVHAIQGTTVTGKYFVDLDKSFWESGQAFVALSRPKSIDQLHLINTHFEKVFIDPYYKRLNQWMIDVDELAVFKRPRILGDFPLQEKKIKDFDLENIHPQINVEDQSKNTYRIPKFRPPRKIGCDEVKIEPMIISDNEETVSLDKSKAFKHPRKVEPIAIPFTMLDDDVSMSPSLKTSPTVVDFSTILEKGENFDDILMEINNVHHIHHITDPNIKGGSKKIWNRQKKIVLRDFEQDCVQYSDVWDDFLDRLIKTEPCLYANEQLHNAVSIPSSLLNTFKPVSATGDGRCAYHSISINLVGNESITNALKVLLAFKIFTEKEEYETLFARFGRRADDVLLQVLSYNAWAESAILFGLSKLLQRSIYSYARYRNADLNESMDLWYCGYSALDRTPLCIAYVNISNTRSDPNHYIPLLKVSSDIVLPVISKKIELNRRSLQDRSKIDIVDLTTQLDELRTESPIPKKKRKIFKQQRFSKLKRDTQTKIRIKILKRARLILLGTKYNNRPLKICKRKSADTSASCLSKKNKVDFLSKPTNKKAQNAFNKKTASYVLRRAKLFVLRRNKFSKLDKFGNQILVTYMISPGNQGQHQMVESSSTDEICSMDWMETVQIKFSVMRISRSDTYKRHSAEPIQCLIPVKKPRLNVVHRLPCCSIKNDIRRRMAIKALKKARIYMMIKNRLFANYASNVVKHIQHQPTLHVLSYEERLNWAINRSQTIPKMYVSEPEQWLSRIHLINFLIRNHATGVQYREESLSLLCTVLLEDINAIFYLYPLQRLREGFLQSLGVHYCQKLDSFFFNLINQFEVYLQLSLDYLLRFNPVVYQGQLPENEGNFSHVSHVLVPVYNSGGNCAYRAVSMALVGDASLTTILKLLLAYKIYTDVNGQFAKMYFDAGINPNEVFLRSLVNFSGSETSILLGLSKLTGRQIIDYDGSGHYLDSVYNGNIGHVVSRPIIVGSFVTSRQIGHCIALLPKHENIILPPAMPVIGYVNGYFMPEKCCRHDSGTDNGCNIFHYLSANPSATTTL